MQNTPTNTTMVIQSQPQAPTGLMANCGVVTPVDMAVRSTLDMATTEGTADLVDTARLTR